MAILDGLVGKEAAPAGPIQSAEGDERHPLALTPDEAAQIPPVKQIVEGEIPGVYVNASEKDDPLWSFLKINLPVIGKLGLGVYKSADSSKVALFNPETVPDIKSLDAQGQLDSQLVPFSQFAGQKVDLGALRGQPKTEATGSTTDLGVQPAASPTPAQPIPSTPPATGKKLATTRLANLTPDQPTEGPRPGAGRLINGLLKRAV